ncbi:glycosyltransferase [Sphaerobacter thermophilus]|uniref:Glycosyl transferase group 1 n=1 Tax=Sphaerobacter thermophilus (strain ATCC 49802 / DSM 20745 / KCCM 41009 / NCIMB 13125 / S 6022) TaxID=479434 RepID=D1C5Y1_SPHTD|nr:glycosyltransferase [Sphaerobacter thermophilus]ACZ39533.1 glycosyl transferase group 1 [Sphaerobacter thermophilus DSM 20745]
MLELIDVGTQSIDAYAASAGAEVVEELRALAEPLRGVRVLHLNATPYGGGVAEILRSKIPLLRDLGLAADWRIICGDEAFFTVTKKIHNGLQGAPYPLTPEEKEIYQAHSKHNAEQFERHYDVIVVHDPQPLALLHFHGRNSARWIWRCHIDTSEPNLEVWDFLLPYLEGYDAAVFTLGSFVPPRFPAMRVDVIPPAIDPVSPKNLDLDPHLARRVLEWIGVEVDKPLITQVSRFDPWKDPLGVIEGYKMIKSEVPDLQLALVGSMALDDPEAWDIYRQIREAANADPGIHVYTNLTGVGNLEVNAFQRLSDVIVQKSIREGFGLVVSEALWKGTPVVAGQVGGIPLQMPKGIGGFLVKTIEEYAERTLWLLRHPEEGKALAELGRERVRKRFLLTRLIADELRLYRDLLSGEPLAAEVCDPVCGHRVAPGTGVETRHGDTVIRFCSEDCLRMFLRTHDRFEWMTQGPEMGKSGNGAA